MEKETANKCAWCGRTGKMKIAQKVPPRRYWCNWDCCLKWNRINQAASAIQQTQKQLIGSDK